MAYEYFIVDIDNVLRHEDIEGLLELGAPEDEYSHVARIMADVLSSADTSTLTENDITAIISQVWARHFDLSVEDIGGRLPAMQRVAHQLLSRLI